MAGRLLGMQDWMSKLERAKALFDAGALTAEEFETEKARLLPAPLSTYADRGEHIASQPLEEVEPTSRAGVMKAAIIALIMGVIATFAYSLFAGQALQPDQNSNPPVKTAARAPARPKASTQTPTPTVGKALDQLVAPTADTSVTSTTTPVAKKASGWTATEKGLIAGWIELNERCRGGSGDDPKTMEACELREAASAQLDSADICYGEEGQFGYQMKMHRCNERSTARQ